jgi:galactokinase/mevalonate kinase-like predicted kinase
VGHRSRKFCHDERLVAWTGQGSPPHECAGRLVFREYAFKIEMVLGIIGGKEDQCASAVGGIRVFEFSHDGIRSTPVGISSSRTSEREKTPLLNKYV